MFSSPSPPEPKDPILGVDVSGSLFYFRRSKLLQCGSDYFSQRLGGKWRAEVAYKDEQGRSVIFLERSPTRFQYIRDYILTLTLHIDDNDNLRRALREEALYFGMESLLEALKVNCTFSPSDYNQGVLYWLGTKRGTTPYQNPYAIGAIHVGGWVDDFPVLDFPTQIQIAASAASREALVQYRQAFCVEIDNKEHPSSCFWRINSLSKLLWCDHAIKRLPVVVDMKSVQVRPTHYSLRASNCYGMHGDWNFEASKDGEDWDVLHAARGDKNLFVVSEDSIKEKVNNALMGHAVETRTDELCSEVLLGVLEQDHRHTWELTPRPTQFYRYFRILGASNPEEVAAQEDDEMHEDHEEDEHEQHSPATCLHGEGLELFGDVYVE